MPRLKSDEAVYQIHYCLPTLENVIFLIDLKLSVFSIQ